MTALSWEQIPAAVSAAIGGRPVRWASAGPSIGDYDGRETTLDVFNVEARDQRRLLRELRDLRREIEEAIGSPVVLVFHTPAQTVGFYPDVGHRPDPGPRLASSRPTTSLAGVLVPPTIVSKSGLGASAVILSSPGPASTVARNRMAGPRPGRIALPWWRA